MVNVFDPNAHSELLIRTTSHDSGDFIVNFEQILLITGDIHKNIFGCLFSVHNIISLSRLKLIWL